jgi:1,4-alpha-glucan branching enzyme
MARSGKHAAVTAAGAPRSWEGSYEEIYEHLGAHVREIDGVSGTAFAVWAPSAASVAVVGDFNSWDGRLHRMRALGASGIWELFLPDVGDGARYKFEIRAQSGGVVLKADPYAFATELPPLTSSVVHTPKHAWRDDAWIAARRALGRPPLDQPISVYEVHLGSWRRSPDSSPDEPLDYETLARDLAAYAKDMGFTHIELLPVVAHPYAPSWATR